MDLIIDFYKELDTLNLIIFWGIIIVIVLLLIFSFILINKNKKLKKIVEQKNKYEEDLPIKEEIVIKTEPEEIYEETSNVIKEDLEQDIILGNDSEPLEIEKDFVAEEHVSDYHVDVKPEVNINIPSEEPRKTELFTKTIEIPDKPYQRNVLREMSLSQTSPIGITRPNENLNRRTEMIKDLESSLKNEEDINITSRKVVDEEIKNELKNIENPSNRKTEIEEEYIIEPDISLEIQENTNVLEEYEETPLSKVDEETNQSEKYLEEVSRKLAEAEIPDEIERTNYEIQQEEDAIISYTELMEKKDSIQTIDEEEAIISIEELMNRTNSTKEEIKEDSKLYNISEEEANDNFIKELKQFRSDL